MNILQSITQFAADKINPGDIGVPRVTNADAVVGNILTTVYMVAGIVCVLVIIVAGILYTTSSADASQVKRAKNAIIGAVVGIVIIASAFIITQFVLGRF